MKRTRNDLINHSPQLMIKLFHREFHNTTEK